MDPWGLRDCDKHRLRYALAIWTDYRPRVEPYGWRHHDFGVGDLFLSPEGPTFSTNIAGKDDLVGTLNWSWFNQSVGAGLYWYFAYDEILTGEQPSYAWHLEIKHYYRDGVTSVVGGIDIDTGLKIPLWEGADLPIMLQIQYERPLRGSNKPYFEGPLVGIKVKF